jgi:hypothetical protein
MARSNNLIHHGRPAHGEDTLTLQGHTVRTLQQGSFPYCIEVLQGIAYVTREGDSSDYFVPADSWVTIDGPGSVVVEGFPNAELKISA